jgi:hypothetical protein
MAGVTERLLVEVTVALCCDWELLEVAMQRVLVLVLVLRFG